MKQSWEGTEVEDDVAMIDPPDRPVAIHLDRQAGGASQLHGGGNVVGVVAHAVRASP